MKNVLTFDVEDWYQLVGERFSNGDFKRSDRLQQQIDRLLGLLDQHHCRATFFFCLGRSLESDRQLVRRIADAGHEIGSHGWDHQSIESTGLEAFGQDLRRSVEWLQDITGRPVLGYRAPVFSVASNQLERFYDICVGAGLRYDSSVFPMRLRRYGIPGGPVAPTVVRDAGTRFVELPLTVVSVFGKKWPVSGGGYWRQAVLAVVAAANPNDS